MSASHRILRRLATLAIPAALLAGCSAAPASTEPATEPTDAAAAAPEFVPVPERDLVAIYDDPFDDNSGDWLEPGNDENAITGGEFVVDGLAAFSTRWIGEVAQAMPQPEVQATAEFRAENLAEVGLYCRLDTGFTSFYRFVMSANGTRITKAVADDDVPIDLFSDPGTVLDANHAGTMAMACFEELDGFHVEAFLDGELVAQAIDTEEPPPGGVVRVAWANQAKDQSEGPYVFRMSRFLLEVRA
jgi:hypothetical protein